MRPNEQRRIGPLLRLFLSRPNRASPAAILLRLLPRFAFASAAPLLLWLFGILALAVPTQTADLLVVGSTWQLVWFYVAVFVWGLSCWFWLRWSLNLEPTRPPEFSPALLAQFRRVYGGSPPKLPDARRRDIFVRTPGAWLRRNFARLPLYTVGFVVMIPVLRSANGRTFFNYCWWIGLNLAAAAAVTGLLWLFALRRHRIAGRFSVLNADGGQPPPVGPASAMRPKLGICACLRRLPFGRLSFLLWLLPFVGLAAAFAWDGGAIASWLGAPATAFLGAAVAGGTLCFIVLIIGRGLGLPGATLMLGWLWLGGQCIDNHAVRLLEAEATTPSPAGLAAPALQRRPDRRPELRQAIEAWLARCTQGEQAPRLLLVATAGGASRAALFTARALRRLEERLEEEPGPDDAPPLPPGTLRRALFALSGVSGGSLGAVAWAAALPPQGCEAGPGNAAGTQARWRGLRDALAENFLAPPIGRYLTTDLLARLTLLQLPDRAAALEQAWENAFRRHLTSSGSAPIPTAAQLGQSFLGLWMAGEPRAGESRGVGASAPGAERGDTLLGRLPLLLLNGTHAGTGLPILTAPVQVTQDQFPLALDLLDLVGRDLRLSTAISNSARFPFITPGGALLPHDETEPRGQVVDGGYVENFGADTIRDLIAALEAWQRQRAAERAGPDRTDAPPTPRLRIAVLQISSDPSMRQEAIPRCGPRPVAPLGAASGRQLPRALDDVISPLLTVAEVRGARGLRSAGDLARSVCQPPGEAKGEAAGPARAGDDAVFAYAHFALCNDDTIPGLGEAREVIGLNWALPQQVVDYLAPTARGSTEAMDACGNREQLEILRRWFAAPPPAGPAAGSAVPRPAPAEQ